MKKQRAVNAMIWAAVMIAVSLMIQGHENSNTVVLLMIAGWIATGGLSEAVFKNECAAFKRLLGKKS